MVPMNPAILIPLAAICSIVSAARVTCRTTLPAGSYDQIDISGASNCVLTNVKVQDVSISGKASLATKGKTLVLGTITSTSRGEIKLFGKSIAEKIYIHGGPTSNLTVGRSARANNISMIQTGSLKLYGKAGPISMLRSGPFRSSGGTIEGTLHFGNTSRPFRAIDTRFSADIVVFNTNSTIGIRNTRGANANSSSKISGSIIMTGYKGVTSLRGLYVVGNFFIRESRFGRVNIHSSSVGNIDIERFFLFRIQSSSIRGELRLIRCSSIDLINVNVIKATNITYGTFIDIQKTEFSKTATIDEGTSLGVSDFNGNGVQISRYTSVDFKNSQFGDNNLSVFHVTSLELKNVSSVDEFSAERITYVLTKDAVINRASFIRQTVIELVDSVFYDLSCRRITSVEPKNVTVIGSASGLCRFVK